MAKPAVRKTPESTKPKEEPKKAVAVVQEALPAHMRADVNMGKETIGSEDLEVPRIKLMQGISKELELFDDLRPGDFLHTASNVILKPPFKIVPIFHDRRYILWNPLEAGGGILARADDGIHWSPPDRVFKTKLDKKDGGVEVTWKTARTVKQSGLNEWGTMNPSDSSSPPAATLMLNFIVAFPEEDLPPAVLTFQRAAIRAGRRFNTRLKTSRGPIFGSMYELSSGNEQNKKGQSFKIPMLAGAGFVSEDLYETYKSMYQSFAATGLNIRDIDGLQDEPIDDDPSDNGGDDNAEGRPNY